MGGDCHSGRGEQQAGPIKAPASPGNVRVPLPEHPHCGGFHATTAMSPMKCWQQGLTPAGGADARRGGRGSWSGWRERVRGVCFLCAHLDSRGFACVRLFRATSIMLGRSAIFKRQAHGRTGCVYTTEMGKPSKSGFSIGRAWKSRAD